MSDRNRFPYLPGNRFEIPNNLKEISSPYDQDSRLLQDLAQRNLRPVSVRTLDLSAAGSLSIDESGFHFVQYGHDNSTDKAVDTKSLVNVQINTKHDRQDQVGFPAKHARGYSGPFVGLFLTWPAQPGVFCDFIIFKNSFAPWIDGEAAT